jgi:hypothetical protein
MHDHENAAPAAPKRVPWNKGKLIGAKPPLRPKRVWSIRTKLQIECRTRGLAFTQARQNLRVPRREDASAIRARISQLHSRP